MWRLDDRNDGIVTVWCVGSVNEWLTVDAIAAAKGAQETTRVGPIGGFMGSTTAAVTADPVGQFRDTVADGLSNAMSS